MLRKYILAVLVLLFFIFPLFIQPEEVHSDSIINASLSPNFYYSIVISEKLSEGILFTNQTGAEVNVQYPLLSGTNDNDAVWNYNDSDQTEYWIHIAGTSPIDVCQGAQNHLCSNTNCTGADNEMIDISNAEWTSSLSNDASNPSTSGKRDFMIGFDNSHKVASDLLPPDDIYLRYWLDVPANTTAHDYDTLYQIMGVFSGGSCA